MPAFPRKRRRPRRAFPVSRVTRPGAMSRTARPSACPPRRWSAAPRRCRGCGIVTPGRCWPWAGRAARERDHGRCRFPGCESRRADLHHIQHWVNGGPTDLANLISLCPWHHKIVHDRGYTIAARPGGAAFAFYRPDGTRLPPCPPLPEPDGPIDQAHDAEITPDTIIPPWYGERLDLNHAIWTCFANARTREERERGEDGDPADRGCVTIYEPEDWPERYRQYREHTPRRTGPTLIPIQV